MPFNGVSLTMYIYFDGVLKHRFEVLVYFHFILLVLHYILKGNVVHFSPLHVLDSCSYFSD